MIACTLQLAGCGTVEPLQPLPQVEQTPSDPPELPVEIPEKPAEQETPDEPEVSTEPEVPAEPEVPTEPEVPAEEEVPEEPEVPDEPEHSALYLPGVSVEDVILWFNEVCLSAEYVMGGDPSYLQRWESPIFYTLNGAATETDLQVLRGFVEWLNTVEGFPGMYETTNVFEANLDIYFCAEQELIDRMGDQFYGTDGAVTFWYDYNVIYDATICYRTEIEQNTRNSVILEEIYNGLGPIQDTSMRPDSIIYSEFSTPQQLTDIDELILRLLYHPDMSCGMNAEECEAVIRTLYY